jgi:hypothetical protein
MDCHLVVVRAFGAYRIGQAIAEAKAIEAVLAGEHRRNVVRVRTVGEGA